jgi:serine/threonine protein phosphatase PrpC
MATWQPIGYSQRGNSHKRRSLPNQDAIEWYPWLRSDVIVVAVADGHGSNKCFRSQKGSSFAVTSAISVFSEMLVNLTKSEDINLSTLKHIIESDLPNHFIRYWQEQVDRFDKQNPILPAEKAYLETHLTNSQFDSLKKNHYVAYGSTFIAVFIFPRFLTFAQIGDGDIVCVMEDGSIFIPFESDDRFISGETDSLCFIDAEKYFKVKFMPVNNINDLPALVMLSTDGYSNSFTSIKDFQKVSTDIFKILKTGNFDQSIRDIEENIENWLLEASDKGSGDDVTLGLICKQEAFMKNQ